MRGEGWIAAALLAGLAAALWHAARSMSATVDEPLHLAAGLVLWELNDHRLSLEHGPLPRRLLALPAWLAGMKPPAFEGETWRTAALGMGFGYCDRLTAEAGLDLERWLASARAVNIAVALLAAAAAWRWARSLFGPAGGLWALAGVGACPTLLAHGSVATTDIWATLAFLLAAWRWDRLVTRPTKARLAWSVAATAFLFTAKLSAPVMAAVAAALVLWRRLQGARRSGRTLAGWIALHGFAAWLAIWAAYGGRHALFAPGHERGALLHEPWERLLPEAGLKRAAIDALRASKLLPDAFVYGAMFTAKHGRHRPAYLLGRYTETRFPLDVRRAGLLKTPPLTALAFAAAAWLAFAAEGRRAAAPAALALVYALATSFGAPNIGVRHLLPGLVAGHVLTGVLALRPGGRWLLAAATLAAAVDGAANHPHHLAYLTPLAGGWPQGHRWLANSNTDWGQDNARAAAWLAEPHPGNRYVWLFCGRLECYGARPRPPLKEHFGPQGLDPAADLAGEYLVSSTTLRLPQLATAEAERTFREAEAQALARAADPDLPAAQRAADRLARENAAAIRLVRWLGGRRPDGYVGHSMLVFRLSDAEVRAAAAPPTP